MLTPRLQHSRLRPSRLLTALALAATASLAAAPVAAAQSTVEADGAITVSSLGDTFGLPAASSDLTGSLAPAPYAEYVALGDSYAALGATSEPAGGPESCQRSLANYPNQLAATDARVGELTDATCGGATVPDLTDERASGVAPQFDGLSESTDLVTLSIGGNDVGFGKIVACLTRQNGFEDTDSCRDALDVEVSSAITSIAPTLDEVYDTIAAASPDATIITTQYLPLMPPAGESCDFTGALADDDVAWAREVTTDINAAVDAAAVRKGHISVMPADAAAHSACAPADERWTSFLGAPDNTAGMHPTALGQEAMAAAVSAEL